MTSLPKVRMIMEDEIGDMDIITFDKQTTFIANSD